MKRLTSLAAPLALFLAVILPLGGLIGEAYGLSGYVFRVISMIFMAIALSQATNIMVGLAGYPALGNLVFFGTGAYTAGTLMVNAQFSFPVAALAGALVSACYAAILGLPILRLKGAYFSIATIGVNEATREIVLKIDKVTGGGKGLQMPFFDGSILQQQLFFYYLMLGMAVLGTGAVWWISRSPLGYGLRALKADEDGAAVIGVKTTQFKVTAWAISAAITGLTGASYAYWISFLEPAPVFDIVTSVKYYIIAILGGAGTVVGPILGAFFFEYLSEAVWSQFFDLHMLVLGGLIVLVVLFIPKGLVSLLPKLQGLLMKLQRRVTGQKGGKAA
jgi:branched-chain amino acid transport system permease protein